MISTIKYSDGDFFNAIKKLTEWNEEHSAQVHNTVQSIIDEIRQQGDNALLSYTQKFDGLEVQSVKQLEVSSVQLTRALDAIDYEARVALENAADRVRQFHEKQRQHSWDFTDEMGNRLGQRVTPLDRAGIYVPGGKASYPSSVLMNAIPAKVAGVEEIVMAVPTPRGERNDMVFAAAAIAGVDQVFTIGGAQAVAALAYGTATVPAVDKIVGPGNIFVATAKKMVFGKVGIDMIAGPSEILVVADGSVDPDWIAIDLFSQAEHDEIAQSILVCHDEEYLDKVKASIEKLLPEQPRSEIIAASLKNRGALLLADSMSQCLEVVNQVAPEHLQLAVADPESLLPGIRHAGAIFMGRYTAEVLGDYCAGPNHVLPTSGTARFASPLGVYDFQKRSSIIQCSANGASELGKIASKLALTESLHAHAQSAQKRILPES